MQSEVNLRRFSVWKCVAVNANAKQIMKINTEFAVE